MTRVCLLAVFVICVITIGIFIFIDIRTPSRSSWDENVSHTPAKISAWDTPTPSRTSVIDEPSFSVKKHSYKLDTPLPTPTHLYNDWAEDRKSFGIKFGEGSKFYYYDFYG